MPIPKIDPKKIFASQAPSQDVPAEFNNYERGWDESRKNNGKPTIKQFNKLQQLTDEKILWIHENGGALPFDETMEYEDGAVVVKDGLIQQKSGASWVIPFMRGSQNLAELTDVAQARVKLDVYAKSEALSKNNNLSDVANKATARANLDVYSKTETNSIAGTPSATETVAGKAKIATTAIAQAGVNDTDIITALKLKNTLGASKNALAGSVDFNGTGTVSIRSQLNVSSITDLGVGKYKINMTTAMPNANYPVFTSVADRSNGSGYIGIEVKAQTTNSITVQVFATGTGGAVDVDFISVGWTP